MGRTIIPTYYAETRDNRNLGWLHLAWNCRDHGWPSVENAERYRDSLNKSFKIGGVNEHISRSAGILVHVSELRIIHNKTGEVVASAKAPLFEVV